MGTSQMVLCVKHDAPGLRYDRAALRYAFDLPKSVRPGADRDNRHRKSDDVGISEISAALYFRAHRLSISENCRKARFVYQHDACTYGCDWPMTGVSVRTLVSVGFIEAVDCRAVFLTQAGDSRGFQGLSEPTARIEHDGPWN
jgi:hypothetical protein